MAQYNPMLVRLQRMIEEHNKTVQQTIDKVATRQKFITIGAILINLFILFLTNYLLPDDSQDASKRLVKFLSNSELNILITVVSIGLHCQWPHFLAERSLWNLK